MTREEIAHARQWLADTCDGGWPDDIRAYETILAMLPRPGGVTITLPWAVLCPDNDRHGVIKIKGRFRIVSTTRYREALEAATTLVMSQYKGSQYTGRVGLIAWLYEPDKRKRDISNYAKLVHDSLSGVVYEDDRQIERVTWVRGGIDSRNPRCEVTITPIEEKE